MEASPNPSDVWRIIIDMLRRGADNGRHAWHTPVLSTTGFDGYPQSRIVILREFDARRNILTAFTDWRTQKVAELQAFSGCTFHFWSATERVQLQVRAETDLHLGDDIARQCWSALKPHQKLDYRGLAGPGERIEAPRAADPPEEASTEAGFENFCVLKAHITHLTFLKLQPEHKHIKIFYDLTKEPHECAWLAP